MQMLIADKCSAHETSECLCHGVSLSNSKSLAQTMNIVFMNANFQGKDSHEFIMKRNGTWAYVEKDIFQGSMYFQFT